MSTSTIELNGKRYDAATGKPMDTSATNTNTSRVIDGFVRPSRPVQAAKTPTKQTGSPQAHVLKPLPKPTVHTQPKTFDVRRTRSANHIISHLPQHSKTLMRKAVKRPAVSFKTRAKTTTRTDALVAASMIDVLPKRSFHVINEERLQRARTIAKSKLVSRYNTHQLYAPASHLPAHTDPVQAILDAGKPHSPSISQSMHVAKPQRQASHDIFERALAEANSHRQPPLTKKHSKRLRAARHIAGMTLSVSIAAVILGFIAYQNLSSIQMHVAAARAGINATLPRWQPNGFSIGSFKYSAGTVAVDFQNNTASRDFHLVQTVTNWDSNALLSNFILSKTTEYDTIESAGNTIYTYGNNNATWITGGIWYQLTTNGALSTSQIVHLATSM